MPERTDGRAIALCRSFVVCGWGVSRRPMNGDKNEAEAEASHCGASGARPIESEGNIIRQDESGRRAERRRPRPAALECPADRAIPRGRQRGAAPVFSKYDAPAPRGERNKSTQSYCAAPLQTCPFNLSLYIQCDAPLRHSASQDYSLHST